jgi:hypothetical protein
MKFASRLLLNIITGMGGTDVVLDSLALATLVTSSPKPVCRLRRSHCSEWA